MANEWEEQKKQKYRDHDLVIEEIPKSDIASIKGVAIMNFVNTSEADAATLTISAFMGYLTQNGFRIVKEKK